MPLAITAKAASSKDTKSEGAKAKPMEISEIPSSSSSSGGGDAASSFVFKNGKIIFMPVSVGIELQGKVMNLVMGKGRSLPAFSTLHNITTPTDYQYSATLKVFIGERPSTSDNYFLGEMRVKGLSYKKQRQLKIKMTISVDEDGILKANAEEDVEGDSVATEDKWKDLEMTKTTLPQVNLLLLEKEIKSLLAEATLPSNVKADKIERERLEAKNELEMYSAQFKEFFQSRDLVERLNADTDMQAALLAADEQLEWIRCNQYVSAKNYKKMKKLLFDTILPTIRQLISEGVISSDGVVVAGSTVSCSVPESSAAESSVPESSAAESSVPESSAAESSVPESSAAESSVPESSAATV